MCLIVFAYQTQPENDLVLAANRDEFVARPTAPAGFWDEHPDLLAGRDLRAGGTWLGVDRTERFAAVTNFRDGFSEAKGKVSRGGLPSDFLSGRLSPEAYARQVFERKNDYNGFNLLVADREALWYVSDREEAGPKRLLPGCREFTA